MDNIIERINEVYSLLQDDWSKKVFESRIRFPFVYNSKVNECIGYELYDTSRIPIIEKRYGKENIFAICGAGVSGQNLLQAMIHAGYKVGCFVDNDESKQGTYIHGIEVISYEKFCIENKGYVAIIVNIGYGQEYYSQLQVYGYPENKILYHHNPNVFFSKFGWEYFDIPVHIKGKKEVFLDAGCLDGESSKDFIKWCRGEYKKIYAFEPGRGQYQIAKNNLLHYENVMLFDVALGDECDKIYFQENKSAPGSSRLLYSRSENGYEIFVKSIDEILQGEEVTFIKMDIEGAELPAIMGAQDTIKKYKPILAISLYHNEYDILDIPLYIKSLDVDYKFYMRHYSTSDCGFVLYCL